MDRSSAIRDRHRNVIARGEPPCGICGQPIDYSLKYPDPESFVVDHVVPLARGGTDTLLNKQAAHTACNRAKGVDQAAMRILRRSGSLN